MESYYNKGYGIWDSYASIFISKKCQQLFCLACFGKKEAIIYAGFRACRLPVHLGILVTRSCRHTPQRQNSRSQVVINGKSIGCDKLTKGIMKKGGPEINPDPSYLV
jgi:hypothetical protein